MENIKIIIIGSFSNNDNKGLLKVIKDHKKPFVAEYLFSENEEIYESKITGLNPYLFIANDRIENKLFPDWQILMMSDKIAVTSYPDIFDGETLVMYHSSPADIGVFLDTKILKGKKEGMHEPLEVNGYPLFNHIIDAYNSEIHKFNTEDYTIARTKIIEWFEVDELLEYKLELLHQCLDPSKSITIEQKNRLLVLIPDKEEKEKITIALNNYLPDGNDVQLLTILRDKLLSAY